MKALRVVSVFIGLVLLMTAASAGEDSDPAARKSALGKVLKAENAPMEKKVQRWDFDRDPPGKTPAGWIIKQNNPTKELAKWIVALDPAAPSKPNVLAVKTDNANATFNLAIAGKTAYRDLDLSVTLRADSGKLDQGGGPIWRCKDENNYYTCRINPLENNYRLYKVVDGKRKMLKSIEAVTPTGKWFTLRVTMKAGAITCYLDGKKMLEAVDDTFKEAGMIGLWTKADASSSFDDLTAGPIREKVDAQAGGDKTTPEAAKTEAKKKGAAKD